MIKGNISLPGDKSISHRALLFSSLTSGENYISNICTGDDVESTRHSLYECGIKSIKTNRNIKIIGGKLSVPSNSLNCGNSGTTARLIAGLLVGQNIPAKLIGDTSLSTRPMKRIINPLNLMGAKIDHNNDFSLPIKLLNSKLTGINYKIPVASAQIKSCLILAALGAKNSSIIEEITPTRNHTEIMLANMGAKISIKKNTIYVHKIKGFLNNFDIKVPGDPSSAAFFIGAALLIPKSKLVIKNLLLNPTRIGFIKVLKRMNARISVIRQEEIMGEIVGDIQISYSQLNSIDLNLDDIPSMIDELPIFALVASQSDGITRVTGAKELRYKESDRIKSICGNLKKIGVKIIELFDGFIIEGPCRLLGGTIKSHNDHRIAMTFEVANLITNENITIDSSDCIKISFPEFYQTLHEINHY